LDLIFPLPLGSDRHTSTLDILDPPSSPIVVESFNLSIPVCPIGPSNDVCFLKDTQFSKTKSIVSLSPTLLPLSNNYVPTLRYRSNVSVRKNTRQSLPKKPLGAIDGGLTSFETLATDIVELDALPDPSFFVSSIPNSDNFSSSPLELVSRPLCSLMIILSFKLRGFGGPTKLASLKLLLKQVKPDIVFMQETLVDGEKVKHFFLQCFLTWNVVALDPNECSGGLLSGWNPTYDEFCAFGTSAGIFLEGRIKHSADLVKLLNCYAPYKEREAF
jgi:hypothetical protein